MFVLPQKNGNYDPTRNSFNRSYMPLVEIGYFNVLFDNKLFCVQPVKNKQEASEHLSKYQEMMTMQQEIYQIIHIIKINISLLV